MLKIVFQPMAYNVYVA